MQPKLITLLNPEKGACVVRPWVTTSIPQKAENKCNDLEEPNPKENSQCV